MVNSIAVNEPGFGFTAPTVTLTGGNPTPVSRPQPQASGGVDNVTLTDGGSGYPIQPIVEFSLPNLPGGVQATGTATMDANGVVDGVAVVNPGSGYTSAPTVTIWDGAATQAAATPATAVGDHRHRPDRRDLRRSGLRLRAGGGHHRHWADLDRAASATANVAVKGAVTAITVTNPGAGYLTPGLKKFVDTLPGLGPTGANDLGQYIPVAVPDTTTYPGSDYYEIAVVQYRMKFHSRPAGHAAARLRPALDERRAWEPGASEQRQPRSDPS